MASIFWCSPLPQRVESCQRIACMSCFQGRLNQMQRLHHGLCLAQTSRWFYWRQLYLSRFDTLLRYSCFTRPQQHLRFHRCLTFQNRVFTRRLKSSEVWGTGWYRYVDFMWHILENLWSRYVRSMSCADDLSHVIISNVDHVVFLYTVAFWTWWLKFGLSNMHVKITSGPTSGRRGMSTPCLGALFYRTGDSVGASATAGRLWT